MLLINIFLLVFGTCREGMGRLEGMFGGLKWY